MQKKLVRAWCHSSQREAFLLPMESSQIESQLERKEYEIIFFLAWFQYLDCDLMAWMEVNSVFLTGPTFLIA